MTIEPDRHDTGSPPENRARQFADLPFCALGGQPPFEPAAVDRFVHDARIAVLAYVRGDGRPGQVPVWYAVQDDAMHVSTFRGSPKHRALQREPRVCVSIQDERPPYRAVIFDAIAEIRDVGPGSITEGIERRYFGRFGGDVYARMTAEQAQASGMVEIVLRPTELRGFDNSRRIGRAAAVFLRWRSRVPLLGRWS